MKKLLALVVTAVMSFASANVSHAAIVGEAVFAGNSSTNIASTNFNFNAVVLPPDVGTDPGNFGSVPVSTTIAGSLNATSGIFSFTSAIGVFTSTGLLEETFAGSVRSFKFDGTFTPAGALAAFGSNTAAVVVSFTAINSNFLTAVVQITTPSTTQVPPVNTPEPATALIWGGISLMGLVAGYRRKKLLMA